MVIQNYDVQATSQRTYMSLQSSTMLATKNLDAPAKIRFPQSTNQNAQQPAEDTVVLSNGKEKKPNNGLALGHLKQAQKGLKDDSLQYLSAHTNRRPALHSPQKVGSIKGKYKKMPSNPQELKRHLMDLMFELLVSKSSSYSSTAMSGNGSTFMTSEQSSSFSVSFFGSLSGISAASGAEGAARAGWKVESFEYESEQVSYQAQGIINTADGRTINVDINMYMSRQFVSYMNMDIEVQRNLCDPLVINYGGTAASLTGERFSFDLTSDGNMESLAMLSEGSGFLAIDKNGDGKINDGSELFGPNSGCGFSELREYDKDGNGWIDEADEVFDKLVVWHRDENGNDTTYTLKELGIGAIFLGDIATEFSFKDESNETLGVMRSTSFFLKEDGGAGLVSHIDLAV